MYRQRLMKEQQEASKYKDPSILIWAEDNDILLWFAYLLELDDTPYREGVFKVKINKYHIIQIRIVYQQPTRWIPQLFTSKHVSSTLNKHFDTGKVCLDVLKQEWNPQQTIESVIRAVGVMLLQPNADSPFNCDTGNLIRLGDKVGYDSLAQYYTKLYEITKAEFMMLTDEYQKFKMD